MYAVDFLTDIIDLCHKTAVNAFKELVLHKMNPEMDEYQVLESFRIHGLMNTANYLLTLL